MSIRWPNPLDYNEAVQFPEISFEDSELQNGEVELTPIGLPKVASGNFANVFRFDCGSKQYAVKCFLRNVYDQHRRYNHLSQFTMYNSVPNMVEFEYQLKGIRVEENWFPIVKMAWVDGNGLDQFIRKHWSNRNQISRVIAQFTDLMRDLQRLGIAHCDLQHGNILVKDDSIKLVDYDGMFVPAMSGESSQELGHANYQHLQRTDKNFGPDLDNFSAWIIYYSLFFLKLDPALWQRFSGGDECLLFRKADFENPGASRLLNEIANHDIPDIKAQHGPLLTLLRSPITEIPKFAAQATISAGQQNQQDTANSSKNAPARGHTITVDVPKPDPVYPSKWPTIDEYFRSAIRPSKAYSDEKLAKGVPVPTDGKTTRTIEADATTYETISANKTVVRGRNHMVLHICGENAERHYAVKFFLYDLPDRHTRYSAIHKHKKTASNKYFVPFTYQREGIWVGNHWFPVLKMLWVQGENLDDYVIRQIRVGNPGAVEELLHRFAQMMAALTSDGIAHGDLEAKNILVDEAGELKIIDYDAMYVPALANLQSCEAGVKTYQHTARNLTHYGNYLDNFSSLAIYGALSCLARNPPEKFWSWEYLLQHARNQPPPQLRRERSTRMTDGFRVPKHIEDSDSVPGAMFNPVFEKAHYGDRPVDTFDMALQRLARVLREQQKRRIDQVAKLDLKVWNLA